MNNEVYNKYDDLDASMADMENLLFEARLLMDDMSATEKAVREDLSMADAMMSLGETITYLEQEQRKLKHILLNERIQESNERWHRD